MLNNPDVSIDRPAFSSCNRVSATWRRVCCAAGFLIAVSVAAAIDSAKLLDGFDADIHHVMQNLHVPGAAVGVIHDGQVILAKGYGVRDIGQPAPVDADTLFAIGSM